MKILNPNSYLTIQITSTVNFRQYSLWINSDQDSFELWQLKYNPPYIKM